ncbi:Smr-domain-containing protein [Wolfiporia cocos MD-104 SS10]|uniref:Smr-domain-containing protein n=1 Tax=Wolfiporia cocos (strain MD-104) TaxID=742152 RepID=A0A2H3JQU9_WOLCO|nr:Smr-domain-containing protein [Wolfiporia cocos MD-104 SS10]
MGQCFEASKAAYTRGERARAKELSNEGKAHQSERDRLNAEASEWIFAENNRDLAPGEVDLHGLHVKEAITFTDREIKKARRRGDAKLRLIVGKGLHSPQGMAKLKPAIEEMMQENGLLAELDENNAGVLIVDLDGRPTGAGAVIRPDDIVRKLANKEDRCIVM